MKMQMGKAHVDLRSAAPPLCGFAAKILDLRGRSLSRAVCGNHDDGSAVRV
jgi:hypothetical protein